VKKWSDATYYGIGSQAEAAQAILDVVSLLQKEDPILIGWKEYEPPVKAIATGLPAEDGDWLGGDEDDASFAIEWLCGQLNVPYEEEEIL